MINKNIKKRFSRECPTALISDSMEQAKRELVLDVMKEIALNTDYIFRLDTHTSTDPYVDEVVFEAQCRAEEAYYPIPSRCVIVPKQTYLPWPKTVIPPLPSCTGKTERRPSSSAWKVMSSTRKSDWLCASPSTSSASGISGGSRTH